MDDTEDSAVQDFLQILEEHRKNCERQGKYVEAEIAKVMMSGPTEPPSLSFCPSRPAPPFTPSPSVPSPLMDLILYPSPLLPPPSSSVPLFLLPPRPRPNY